MEADAEYLKAVEDGDDFAQEQLVREAAWNAGFRYRRNSWNELNPANRTYVPYRMFVEWKSKDRHSDSVLDVYGEYEYVATDDGAIDSFEIQDDLLRLAREYYGDKYSDEDLLDALLPEDIVDTAGMWDDADFVQYVWDNYFEDIFYQTGAISVKTPDGLVFFDEDRSKIKSLANITYDDEGNLAHSLFRYAKIIANCNIKLQ